MGCLVVFLYSLGIAFFFLMGIVAWSEGEHLQSIASYIISIIVLPIFLFRNKHVKEWNRKYEEDMRKKKVMSRVHTTTIKQILETVYILETTKKYDVFTNRLDFLFDLLKEYMAALEAGNIDKTIKSGLELYMGMYHDRNITPCQIKVLEDPKKNVTNHFIAEQYISFFSRYSRQLKDEQLSLKTQKAKDKRTELLIEVGLKIKDKLQELSMNDYVIEIDNIINNFQK